MAKPEMLKVKAYHFMSYGIKHNFLFGGLWRKRRLLSFCSTCARSWKNAVSVIPKNMSQWYQSRSIYSHSFSLTLLSICTCVLFSSMVAASSLSKNSKSALGMRTRQFTRSARKRTYKNSYFIKRTVHEHLLCKIYLLHVSFSFTLPNDYPCYYRS